MRRAGGRAESGLNDRERITLYRSHSDAERRPLTRDRGRSPSLRSVRNPFLGSGSGPRVLSSRLSLQNNAVSAWNL